MKSEILPPELKSIQELLAGDSRYYVPKYQRSFAWTADEVEELWDDVLSAMGRRAEYFLGTIVVQKKGAGKFEIIDGQQRLACLSMIFSSIRNALTSRSDDRQELVFSDFLGSRGYVRNALPSPKLELNKINNETYVSFVIRSQNLDDIRTELRKKNLHISNKLLLEAYAFFMQEVTAQVGAKGTRYDEFVEPLIDCLRTSFKLITIPVLTEEGANLFFESLNARGKELAVSDLVKNRLYSEAGDQVGRAQHMWEQMEIDLGRRPIPEYLRHFWIAKKADEKSLLVREKKLYRAIVSEVKGKKARTIQLLQDLTKSAGDYAKITDYSLWEDDPAYDKNFDDALTELVMFRVSQCYPMLLNAIQLFNRPKEVAKVFRVVANFSFRYNIIGKQSPGNLERISGKIAYGIRTGAINSPRGVSDALRGVNPDSTFRADFELAVMPKSRAKVARYTLAKLNNYLVQVKRKRSELVVNPDEKKVNLEHVLPQKGGASWLTGVAKSGDIDGLVNRLGNLTLLTKKINHEIANKSFAEKKRLGFANSDLLINDYIKVARSWGSAEIEERQNRLAALAVHVWKI